MVTVTQPKIGAREFDVVVFGATGFAGYYVAKYVANIVKSQKQNNEQNVWTFAIAGRSQARLDGVQKRLEKDVAGVGQVPVIIADALDAKSMNSLCSRTSVVLNCAGPYIIYGESVVKACVENKTHYLDITGEPAFMENAWAKYDKLAKSNDTLIVSATGFDSIPSEMGTVFATEQMEKAGAIPSTVDAFIKMKTKKGHSTTFESAVLAMSDPGASLKAANLRRMALPYVGPKSNVMPWKLFGYNEELKRYFVRFPGPDALVVRNSQRSLFEEFVADAKNPLKTSGIARYGVYYTFPNFGMMVGFFTVAAAIFFLAQFSFTRNMMLKNPDLFSLGAFTKAGPTEEMMKKHSYSFTFFSKGFLKSHLDKSDDDAVEKLKNRKADFEVVTRVTGGDPGYENTSMAMVECARTLLSGEVQKRGVLTTATAFRGTNLIQRLNENGLRFEVLREGTPEAIEQ